MGEATHIYERRSEDRPFRFGDEAAAGSEFALGIEFRVGSESDDEVMRMGGGWMPRPFRDVRRDGKRLIFESAGPNQPLANP
jgi:hypothetical protein